MAGPGQVLEERQVEDGGKSGEDRRLEPDASGRTHDLEDGQPAPVRVRGGLGLVPVGRGRPVLRDEPDS